MSEKTNVKKRRKYDADFKKEVIKMVASGRSVVEISQALGIGENINYRWKKEQRAASLDRTKGKKGSGCMAASGPTAGKTSADGNGARYCEADAALVAGPKKP